MTKLDTILKLGQILGELEPTNDEKAKALKKEGPCFVLKYDSHDIAIAIVNDLHDKGYRWKGTLTTRNTFRKTSENTGFIIAYQDTHTLLCADASNTTIDEIKENSYNAIMVESASDIPEAKVAWLRYRDKGATAND